MTPGPWRLIWWGNETYPYPLSICADDDKKWVTRDGTVSSEEDARLIASAPALYAAVAHLLRRIEADPRLAYYFDPISESMTLLTLAHADALGKNVELFRREYYPRLRFERLPAVE